jgi:hypothetical protein
MDAEWESDFFTTRHLHNKNGAHRQSSSKGSNEFDVRKTYGSYELKCSTANACMSLDVREKQSQTRKRQKKKDVSGPRLEIYRLTDDENGLMGELVLPGVLEATVILTGSRKQLHDRNEKWYDLNEEVPEREDTPAQSAEQSIKEPNSEEVDSDEADRLSMMDVRQPEETAKPTDLANSEARQRQRYETFKKNSFRQPKFWLGWEGRVLGRSAKVSGLETGAPEDELQSGLGYVVFSGNKCRDLKGTLSCDSLGWRDVSFRGWKRVEMKERDVSMS